jgi:hypothetical protein
MQLNRRQFAALAGAVAVGPLLHAHADAFADIFAPDLESLKNCRAPEWFRNAKLGMWAC